MQTSVLRYPKADRFIRIHASLQIACAGNSCAAALIAFFEGWHNFKLEQREYTALFNDMLSAADLPPVTDVSGWQYHTNTQLENGLLGLYKIDTINKALKFLEEQQFISTDVPDRLRLLHATGRTRWFLLRADVLNAWFDRYVLERQQGKRVTAPTRPKRERKSIDDVDNAVMVFEYWRMRTGRQRAVMDEKRLALIAKRLSEGFTTIQLCRAVEGCLRSAFHQGDNDQKKVYDSIELLFRDAAKVESFIAYAAGSPLTDEDIALALARETPSERLQTPLSPAPTDAEYRSAAADVVFWAEERANGVCVDDESIIGDFSARFDRARVTAQAEEELKARYGATYDHWLDALQCVLSDIYDKHQQ